MANNIQIDIGSKLELVLDKNYYKQTDQPLVSQFEELFDDGEMEILTPIFEGRLFFITRNTKVDVIYESGGQLYKFGAIVVGHRTSGNLSYMRIKPVSEKQRFQRRNFFRFKCIEKVEYRIYQNENTPAEGRGDYKDSITRDISGGGICLLTKEKPNRGWFVEGNLYIGQKIHFIGSIVRVADIRNKGEYSYEAGIEFVNISERDREKVISYIFDSQRKLLKKGWYTE